MSLAIHVRQRNLLCFKFSGVVSTLAGSTVNGLSDGEGADAMFTYTYSITASSNGLLYVGESGAIRKVTTSGFVTTLAGSESIGSGDGVGTEATFNGVLGLAVDDSETVYAADYTNNLIRKILPSGRYFCLCIPCPLCPINCLFCLFCLSFCQQET